MEGQKDIKKGNSETQVKDSVEAPAEATKQEEPVSITQFVQLHSTTYKKELLAVLGILITLILFRLRAVTHINDAFLGGFQGDAGLYIWLVKSNIRDLFTLPWFNTSAFYPYTETLAWSDNFILPSLLVMLFIKTGLSLVTSYNLVILLAGFLNGYLTYRLAFKLSGLFLPALASGVCFLALAYFSTQLGHPQLQFAFFFPAAVSVFFSFLTRKNIFWVILLGFLTFLAFLTTVYFAIFIPILILSLLISIKALRPSHITPRDFFRIVLGSLIGLAPLLTVISPYLDVKEMFGQRGMYEPYYFAATALSYLSFGEHTFLYKLTTSWSHSEAHLSPGILILVLSFICFLRLCEAKALRKTAWIIGLSFLISLGLSLKVRAGIPFGYLTALFQWISIISFLVLARNMGKLEQRLGFVVLTNRALIASLLFVALVFFAISLGPLGKESFANPATKQMAFGLSGLLYHFVPGFDSIRAISRAGIVCLFSLCVVLVFAFPLLKDKGRLGKSMIFLVFTFILVENSVSTFPLDSETFGSPAFNYLEQITTDDNALLVLPLTEELKPNMTVKSWGDFANKNVSYMHWAFPSGINLVNGYSGQRSHIMKEYPRKMSGFPDRRSLNAASYIPGLKFIIYVSKNNPNFNPNDFMAKASAFDSELTFVNSDEAGNYLFEFSGKMRIKKGFFLKTPSHPAGYLHLELMAEYETDSPVYKLSIMEEDHFEGKVIATASIPASGMWDAYSFPLPINGGNLARPFKITFSHGKGVRIISRHSAFTPLDKVAGK